MFLNNYHYIISKYALVFALSSWVLFILHMQIVNGVQFLNTTPLFLSPACLAPALVIVHLTSIYASL